VGDLGVHVGGQRAVLLVAGQRPPGALDLGEQRHLLVAVEREQRLEPQHGRLLARPPPHGEPPRAERELPVARRVGAVLREEAGDRGAQQRLAAAEVLVDLPVVDARLLGDLAQVDAGQHAVAGQQPQRGVQQLRLRLLTAAPPSPHGLHDRHPLLSADLRVSYSPLLTNRC